VRKADNLTTFGCRMFITFGNLNLLEPYGPVEACVSIVLLLGDQRVRQREIIGQETNLA